MSVLADQEKPAFSSVSIKKEFAKDIEEFIKANPQLGYRSIASFLEDAARRRLECLRERDGVTK